VFSPRGNLSPMAATGHRLRPAVLDRVKAEIQRISRDGTNTGRKFAREMISRYPELNS
jgi:hypothetical protein